VDPIRNSRGATLIEAVIAIGILAGAVVTLAALVSLAVRSNTLARERTLSVVLALQKMEALSRDASRLPVSPGDTLARDSPGFVEFLDGLGRVVGAGDGVVFVRRWSIEPLSQEANLLAIRVEVALCRTIGGGARCGDANTRARLCTVRSRLVW
jgi:Tfp pilus assembly protein PilV